MDVPVSPAVQKQRRVAPPVARWRSSDVPGAGHVGVVAASARSAGGGEVFHFHGTVKRGEMLRQVQRQWNADTRRHPMDPHRERGTRRANHGFARRGA